MSLLFEFFYTTNTIKFKFSVITTNFGGFSFGIHCVTSLFYKITILKKSSTKNEKNCTEIVWLKFVVQSRGNMKGFKYMTLMLGSIFCACTILFTDKNKKYINLSSSLEKRKDPYTKARKGWKIGVILFSFHLLVTILFFIIQNLHDRFKHLRIEPRNYDEWFFFLLFFLNNNNISPTNNFDKKIK